MEHDGLKWYKFTCALLFIIMAFMGFTMHLMMERMDEINKVNAELKASIPSQNYDIVNQNHRKKVSQCQNMTQDLIIWTIS